MKYIQRVSKSGGSPLVAGPSDDTLAALSPALLEWLTVVSWDDGKKREAGTVMVMAEDGRWKAWLHDRDGKRSCWVTAADVVELLTRAEALLANGGGEWRADKK